MEVQVRHQPSFAVATVTLGPSEPVKAEAGAMVAMSPDTQIQTSTQGGIMKGLKRAMLGGESFFMNTFTAGPGGGWIQVGHHLPGDIDVLDVTEGVWMLQSGSYLASEIQVEVDTQWGGAKTFFGGEGLFLLRCAGTGKLVVSTYGAIDRFTLGAGQAMTVDTGHVVAFREGVQFNVRKVGGLKSTLLSGEGLVVDLVGPGEVLTQTRSMSALESWIRSVVPTSSN